MTTSNDSLVPIQRRDKNGHMVTRWVKLLVTGEQEMNIPAPAAPAPVSVIDSTAAALFPEFNEDSELLLDVFGQDCEYTGVFISHALERLPVKTLREFSDSFTNENISGQNLLALSMYSYLDSVYESGGEDDLPERYQRTVTDLNNALVFHEALSDLSTVTGNNINAESTRYILNWATSCLEDPSRNPGSNHTYPASSIDYSKLPQRERQEAIAFVIAFRVSQCANINNGTVRPSLEAISIIADNLDRQREVITAMINRKTDDAGILKEILELETPVLADGVL